MQNTVILKDLEGINFLIFILKSYLPLIDDKEILNETKEIIEYLTDNLIEFNPFMHQDGYTLTMNYACTEIDKEGKNPRSKVDHILFNNQLVVFAINQLVGRTDKLLGQIQQIESKKEELANKEKNFNKREKAIEKAESKKGKFKRSGHLTDQLLKYDYPKGKSSQLSIFDALMDGTKLEIKKKGIEITEIVEGIKLSPTETRIIDCLCKLLHENSQTYKAKEEDYYSGNIGYEMVEYGGDKSTKAPKLAFTLYELTKEYKGGEYVSGSDIYNVKLILQGLNNKYFLLSYVETTRNQKGGRIERKIEDFKKLIHILKISETEFSNKDIELSKKETIIILLNPIFRRQIDSKFILYPDDIILRTKIAYGNWDIPQSTIKLRDYLMRELSSKRFTPEITQDKLYFLLAEKWMKESRKKKVKEFTDKAIETVITLGLLESFEIIIGVNGEAKIIFKINKSWE